jgi:hypothetical protein
VSSTLHLLTLSTKLVDSISELGAVIMSLTYGINIAEQNDRYIKTAEMAVSTYVLSVLFG